MAKLFFIVWCIVVAIILLLFVLKAVFYKYPYGTGGQAWKDHQAGRTTKQKIVDWLKS